VVEPEAPRSVTPADAATPSVAAASDGADASVNVASAATLPAPEPATLPEVPPPGPPALPHGTTVLHIGDSFAGALGLDLNAELKAAGIRGILKYETSTYIPTWASGKELGKYLDRFQPDLVLITLGANELGIPDPAARIPTIHRLVARLGGRPCVWVAPPLWDGARPDLLETIRASCAPCAYLDSTALVPGLPRTHDKIHPSMEGRKTWAKAVVSWLAEHRAPNGSHPWDIVP
jgi:lysophospholipase L1-like esterase